MPHRCHCVLSETPRGWTFACCCGDVRGPFAYVETCREALDVHQRITHQHVVVLRPMPADSAESLPGL